MDKFIIMSLAFIIIISIGLGYTDDFSLKEVPKATHNMKYNGLKEVTQEVATDLEAAEQTEEEEQTKDSWIETELADDQAKPITNQTYEIIVPDGNIKEGSLEAN